MQLGGLFSQLSIVETSTLETAVPQLNAYDAEHVLRLCRSLMQEHAEGELHPEMRRTAIEQLKQLRDNLKASRVKLTGNACRDLIGDRRVHLNAKHRVKALSTLVALIERTTTELQLQPLPQVA